MARYQEGDVLEALVNFEQGKIARKVNYCIVQVNEQNISQYDLLELRTSSWIDFNRNAPIKPVSFRRWDFMSNVDDSNKYLKRGSVPQPKPLFLLTCNEDWLTQPEIKEFYETSEDLKKLKIYLENLASLINIRKKK